MRHWIAVLLVFAIIVSGTLSTGWIAQAANGTVPPVQSGCTDVVMMVEQKGWIYHQEVEDNGHLVELLEDDVLPKGFEAVGDGVTITATDVNRTMLAGWWTVYPTCPLPTPTPITPTPEPTPAPIETPIPVIPHCGAVDKLAAQMEAEYQGLTDILHNGHLITIGEQDSFLPFGYEAVGTDRSISMTDSNRTMAAGTAWTVYGKCFGYLPLIEASVYVAPTAVPTATPQGVYCLSTETLAQQLGVDVSRLHMDLFDGFNSQPSGWRLDYGEDFISWVVPTEYVVNHPNGEFTGNSSLVLDFQTGSIWLPWSCRQ